MSVLSEYIPCWNEFEDFVQKYLRYDPTYVTNADLSDLLYNKMLVFDMAYRLSLCGIELSKLPVFSISMENMRAYGESIFSDLFIEELDELCFSLINYIDRHTDWDVTLYSKEDLPAELSHMAPFYFSSSEEDEWLIAVFFHPYYSKLSKSGLADFIKNDIENYDFMPYLAYDHFEPFLYGDKVVFACLLGSSSDEPFLGYTTFDYVSAFYAILYDKLFKDIESGAIVVKEGSLCVA